jgi:ComF family protein
MTRPSSAGDRAPPAAGAPPVAVALSRGRLRPFSLRRLLAVAGALLRALGEALLGLLAPPCCAACDEPLGQPAAFCAACASSLLPPGASVEPAHGERDLGLAVVAFGAYGGALGAALRRFKYGSRPDLARPLAELARGAARQAGLRAELVVPVPLHPVRLGERRFNQATLLARRLARELGGRLAPLALARTRPTAPQAGLDRAARRRNVAGAFVAREPARIRGRSVVLVDDVATTGATLADCARALRQAGARQVIALVVARAGAASEPSPSNDAARAVSCW